MQDLYICICKIVHALRENDLVSDSKRYRGQPFSAGQLFVLDSLFWSAISGGSTPHREAHFQLTSIAGNDQCIGFATRATRTTEC